MKATLWLGPKDGLELDVTAGTIREGRYPVACRTDTQILAGTYRLRTAPDGIAVMDKRRRLTFEWAGWDLPTGE